MASERTWQQTRRNDVFDVLLTAALGVSAGISLYMGSDPALMGEDIADYSRPVGIVVVVVCVLPLAVRRRYPVAVLGVITTAYVVQVVLVIPEDLVTVVVAFIAFYSAGAYGGRGRDLARAGVVLVLLVLIVLSAAVIQETEFMSELRELPTFVPAELFLTFWVVQNSFFFAGAWMMGNVMRARREREAELEATTDQLRQAQAENARKAVLEERMYIARELHDVVAHHVAVMGVQAGAARRTLERRPEGVPELLSTVEEASREAVDELQRMLGVLRRDEGTEPTLGQVGVLVDQMRRAGLRVTTDLDEAGGAHLRGLPPTVDRVGYRVVQEALTNTMKHAGPTAVVRLSFVRHSEVLEIEVTDDGAPEGSSERQNGADRERRAEAPGGHGLAGMHERVGALGGSLDAGRRPEGGFKVCVRLPLAPAAEAPLALGASPSSAGEESR